MTNPLMQYIDHGQGGDVSVLQMAKTHIPAPKEDEVLIQVAYAGVNRPDIFQRAGSYPPPQGASPILGLEVSGVVVGIGDNVKNWAVGDMVCALTHGGGYAQFVTANATHCLPVPDTMDMASACAIPETYFTVWSNLFERGRLQSGESVLIHGGSSGIGLTAIQLAKHFGAIVYTTVGTDEKADFCRKMGADYAINYRTQSFFDTIQQLTDNNGVDVILDMVGGDYIQHNINLLRLDGRLIQIAFLRGSKCTLDIRSVMTKRLTVTGSTLRPRTDMEKARICQAIHQHIFPLLQQNTCMPVIHKIFDMADAKHAHALMESSVHIGKIILRVS